MVKTVKYPSVVICDYEGVFTPGRFMQPDAQALLSMPNFPNVLTFIKSGGFTFCTGRSASFLEGVLQLLGLVKIKVPCVVENGAALYWPEGNEVKYHPFIAERIREVLEARIALWMFVHERKLGEVESGKDICLSLNPYPGVSIEALYLEVCEQVMLKKMDALFEITHSASAVDVTPLGINKGSGVEWLIEQLKLELWGQELPRKISLESAMYIGDSSGDLPAMDKVGIPACPDNASKKVKALVAQKNGIIACQPHVYGLIEILCTIGFMKNQRRAA